MEDDRVGLDRTRRLHRGAHGREALAEDLRIGGREVAEVEGVHKDGAEPGGVAAGAELGVVELAALREPPGARALGEELDGVRADLDRAVECSVEPARAVSTEQHAARLAAR
jgi:hypothetical protein